MIEILVNLLNDFVKNERMKHMIYYILHALEIQSLKHYKCSVLIKYQTQIFNLLENDEINKYKSSYIVKISDALDILQQMIKSTNTTNKLLLLLDNDLVYFIICHTKKIYKAQLVNDKIPFIYFEVLHKFISFINNCWNFFTYLSKNEIINYMLTIKMIKISNQNEKIKQNLMQLILNIVDTDKRNIHYLIQKIISIIQKIEFKHINTTIITTAIQHIINYQNYDLLLNDEIIAFMMYCLESREETELISMIRIINDIFESNHELLIKYIFNFHQGKIFFKISTIINNYKSIITDKNKPYFLKILINIKKAISMGFIDIKDLKNKLNKYNFVNSLINCKIISINKNEEPIFNNTFVDNMSISVKTDIMYLVSVCGNLDYNNNNINKDSYTRIKSIILRIISSYSAIEGCSKQYIFNEESLSSESSTDIINTINIMIEKCEIFTTIDEEHYQVVVEEYCSFSEIDNDDDDDDDGLSL